jgi:hypothetical protein
MAITPDLVERFRNFVGAMGEGRRIVGIHLFGIEIGEKLPLTATDCKTLAQRAGFKESLGTELHKGIRLAPYVTREITQPTQRQIPAGT